MANHRLYLRMPEINTETVGCEIAVEKSYIYLILPYFFI